MKRDQLLQNVAFVRTLSRHLVGDADERDEVEQRTLAAALASSPRRAASTRSWLAAIARNAARRLGLSEARRRRRESAVARPEALPAVDELAEKREMIHRVVEEVFALEEPYRSTVLSRFYDELPPREIARRQGVELPAGAARRPTRGAIRTPGRRLPVGRDSPAVEGRPATRARPGPAVLALEESAGRASWRHAGWLLRSGDHALQPAFAGPGGDSRLLRRGLGAPWDRLERERHTILRDTVRPAWSSAQTGGWKVR